MGVSASPPGEQASPGTLHGAQRPGANQGGPKSYFGPLCSQMGGTGGRGEGAPCKRLTGNQTHVVSKTRAQERNGNSRIVPK